MGNPDDANKSTVTITKKDGSKVTQTTYKSSSGTKTYRDGKLVFQRKKGSSVSTRPDKVALARPQKEIDAEIISTQLQSESLTNKPPTSKTEDMLKAANALPANQMSGYWRPSDIIRGATVKKVELSQSEFNKRAMGLTAGEGNTVYTREGSFVAVQSKKDNTLFFTKGFEPDPQPEGKSVKAFANIRAFVKGTSREQAASDIVKLESNADQFINKIPNINMSNPLNWNPVSMSLYTGTEQYKGMARDYIHNPVEAPLTDIAITAATFGFGKAFGFGRGLMATSKAAPSIKWASKGAIKGFTAIAYGLGAANIVASENPLQRSGVIIKDFALFGAGAKLGFKSGLASSAKFKVNQALRSQKAGLIPTNNPVSKDIKMFAQVQKIKGMNLIEQSGYGVKTQRSFLDLGRSKWINANKIPKTDFVRVSASGSKIIKTGDYGINQVYKPVGAGAGNNWKIYAPTKAGLISPSTTRIMNTKTTMLDNKAFARIINQAKLGFGRITKVNFDGKASQSVVKMQFEGMKFSGERGVFNPNVAKSTKVPKFRWLARSTALNPMQSNQILEFGTAVKPSTPFLSLKGQAALAKDLKSTIVFMQPAKKVSIFKINKFKAEPSKKFSEEINIIKDEATGQATIQILKTEKVQAPEPVLKTAVAQRSRVTKSVYEANQVYDLTKQDQIIKTGTEFGTGSKSLTGQRFGNLTGLSFKNKFASTTSTGLKTNQSQKQAQAQKIGQAQIFEQLPVQQTSQLIDSRSATDSMIKTTPSQRITNEFLSSTSRKPPSKTPGIQIPSFEFGKLPKTSGGGLFAFEIGKPGNKIRRFVKGSNFEDTVLRSKKIIKGSAAASFKSLTTLTSSQERNINSLLGSDFRRAKRDPSRFVQKRSKRISSSGEKKDITYKGLRMQRFKNLRGFSL